MKEEKYSCPNVDCDHISFEAGSCPQCDLPLEKIKGEDYFSANDTVGEENTPEPMISEFNDDPEDVSWYSDEPASI